MLPIVQDGKSVPEGEACVFNGGGAGSWRGRSRRSPSICNTNSCEKTTYKKAGSDRGSGKRVQRKEDRGEGKGMGLQRLVIRIITIEKGGGVATILQMRALFWATRATEDERKEVLKREKDVT